MGYTYIIQNSWKTQATTMRSKCTNTFSISRMSKWFSRLLQIEVCWHFDESNILILGIFDTSHWFDEKYWKFHIYLLNISDNFQFLNPFLSCTGCLREPFNSDIFSYKTEKLPIKPILCKWDLLVIHCTALQLIRQSFSFLQTFIVSNVRVGGFISINVHF